MTIALNQAARELIRPFQVEDSQFLAARKRAFLGHKTGMGKTLIGLAAWSLWPNIRKTLILGKKSSMAVWSTQPADWTNLEGRFVEDTSDWQEAVSSRDGTWMMTYEMYLRLTKGSVGKWKSEWDLVICDAAHKLRNRKTQIVKALHRLEFDHFIGMSATWASRGPQDLWAVLNLIAPAYFPSYWRFVETWCFVERTTFGTEVFGVRNLDNLKKLMSQYYRTRTWKEIGRQFDPVERRMVKIRMTVEQRRLHDELTANMMAMVGDRLVVTGSVLALITRLRQVAVSPKLLSATAGYGAGIEYLVDALEDDPHTVIFTPFTEAIPIIEQAFKDAGYEHILHLWGGMQPAKVNAIVAEWKRLKGIMLCSIGFAEAFAMDTTHTAYFLGFDWDPNQNIEAEGRLRRLDSELVEPCIVNYIFNQQSIEDHVQEVVNNKVRTVSQVFQDMTYLMRGHGREVAATTSS